MAEEPAALVFLTDLVCDDFGSMPSYPVLWAVLEGLHSQYSKVPYGEIVEVSNDE